MKINLKTIVLALSSINYATDISKEKKDVKDGINPKTLKTAL